MGRLKELAPRVGGLRDRAASASGSQPRNRVDVWRRWYKTAAWQRLRWEVIEAAGFACARCGWVGRSPDLVADHVRPHRGDADLFWDRANLQCLCVHCHAGDKQREERRGD